MNLFFTRSPTLFVPMLLLGLFGCGSDRAPDSVPSSETEAGKSSGSQETRETPPVVVASVGTIDISFDDVLSLTRDKEAGARAVRPGDTVESVLREIRTKHLHRMIDRRLLILYAAQYPDLVSDASLTAEVKRRLIELGPAEVERRKKLANIPAERFQRDFRKLVHEEMAVAEIVRREIDDRLTLTEEELRARYDRDREDSYRRPDSWAVYHIAQYLPRDQKDDLPELVGRLEEVRAEVGRAIESATTHQSRAERMAPFVKEHSQDPSARSGYVFLYDTPKAEFDPAFVDRVRSTGLGQLSEVFELSGDEERVGACFLLTFEHRPGEYAPYERVRRILRGDMLEEKRKALFAALFDRLKNDFPVTIHEDLLCSGLEATSVF